jgi:hypothetical protein
MVTGPLRLSGLEHTPTCLLAAAEYTSRLTEHHLAND